MKQAQVFWAILCILLRFADMLIMVAFLWMPLPFLLDSKEFWIGALNLRPIVEDPLTIGIAEVFRVNSETPVLAVFGFVVGTMLYCLLFIIFLSVFGGCPWWYLEEYAAARAGLQGDRPVDRFIDAPICVYVRRLNKCIGE